MKKLYFVIVLMFVSVLSFAQIFLNEDFSSNAMPPQGWTIDAAANRWAISPTNNAGGASPEAKFSWINQNTTSRLISPLLDLSGVDAAALSFRFGYGYYGPDVTIGVAARLDGGNWEVAWQETPSGNIASKFQLVEFTGINHANFQFCLFISGNLNNVLNWYIDEIRLSILQELDAELVSVEAPTYLVAGNSFDLKGTVSNQGSTPITSFDVSYRINGGDPQVYSVSGVNLVLGDKYVFTHDIPISFAEVGVYEVEVSIINVNGGQDLFPENNMIVVFVNVPSFIPTKKVLAEEATGTWCPWCVRGICNMDYMAETYPDTWIGVAVHCTTPSGIDPMNVPIYCSNISNIIPGFTGYPSVTTDRTPGDRDPSNLESGYLRRIQEISPASIDIVNYSWNPETREVNFDLRAEFVAQIDTELRFGVIFVEDSLWGTTSQWAQANGYAGSSPMCGYENLPNPVPASQMHYDHVARAILDTPFGTPGSLPLEIAFGSVHSYNYSYTIPETWRYDKLSVIGFLVNMQTKEILNANNVISHYVGVDTPKFEQNVAVYPNPFNEYTNISFTLNKAAKVSVQVLDRIGRTVYTINEREYAAGQNNIRVNSNELSNGVYVLRLTVGNQVVTRNISVIK